MSKLRDVYARLAEIKARAEKATPGPWVSSQSPSGPGKFVTTERGEYASAVYVSRTHGHSKAGNSDFIAAARTDVPDMAEALEQAMGLLSEIYEHGNSSELNEAIRKALGR